MSSSINKENGAFFLRTIAREYFSEKKDDCFDLLNKAADEIERLQTCVAELERARDAAGQVLEDDYERHQRAVKALQETGGE